MSHELSLNETKNEWHGSLTSYLAGFFLSLFLTALSFGLVVFKLLVGKSLVYTLVALAILQATVQVLFFLHLGQEPKPRWETWMFYFMIMVLIIIAGGSLWIMNDLNDRVMANMRMDMSHD